MATKRGKDGKDQCSFGFAQPFGGLSDSAQRCCLSERQRTDANGCTKSTSWGSLVRVQSAATIAASLADHGEQILVAAYLLVFYAAAFPIWLVKLHRLVCGNPRSDGFPPPARGDPPPSLRCPARRQRCRYLRVARVEAGVVRCGARRGQ